MLMKTFFFIPARGGSKRFPKKNMALLAGKPLICHGIDAIRGAFPDAHIVVSTDDDAIASAVQYHDKKVICDDRPKELGSDTASVAQTLQEYLGRTKPAFENAFCLYPTAVMTKSTDIQKAVADFEANPQFASLMAASEYNLHPWQALYQSEGSYKPYFPDLFKKKSQEFPHFVASNGSFYLVRTAGFHASADFYKAPLQVFTIDPLQVVDINYPQDLERAEALLQLTQQKGGR